MKFEKYGMFGKIALILGSIVEAGLILTVIYFGLIWLGNLLEVVCNHLNVGLGILMICVIGIVFICIDSRNSVEQSEEYSNHRKSSIAASKYIKQ